MKKLILFFSILFVVSLQAQDTTKHVCEDVIIYGTRASNNTPVTQQTLEKSDIQEISYGQEMPLFLAATPSVTASADNGGMFGYTYFRLRGIDQTRINMTLNGMPLNEPEDEGVYFSNFPDFTNSLKSIQIQRGVGTSSNGVSDFAGSINFESEDVFGKPEGTVQFGYGSYNTYRASTTYKNTIDSSIGIYFRYSSIGTDGFIYHSGNISNSFFASVGYKNSNSLLKVTAFTGNAQNGMAYVGATADDINADPRTNYLSPDEKDNFNQSLVQTQYINFLSDKVTSTTSLYFIALHGDYTVKIDSSTLQDFGLKSDWAGAMENISYVNDNLKLDIGLHCYLYKRNHFSSYEPFNVNQLYSNTGYKNEFSEFIKATYTIDKFSLYADLQNRNITFHYNSGSLPFDFFDTLTNSVLSVPPSDISWSFLNPKFGITYQANSELNLYVSAGQNTREPTRNVMFQGYDNIDQTNIADIQNFSYVKPETVLDIELGTNINTESLQLQANGYWMQFHNEIDPIGALSYIGLPLMKNVPSSYRSGIELNGSWRINSMFTLFANANFELSKIKQYVTEYDTMTYDNVTPLLTPRFVCNAILQWVYANFDILLVNNYVSLMYLDNTDNINSSIPGTYGLSTEIKYHYKNSTFSISINNLYNGQYYFTNGYVQNGVPYYYAQAPRNFFLSYQLNF